MENEKNKEDDFSLNKGNLEVVSQKNDVEKNVNGACASITRAGLDVRKGGNIIIGSLNIIANPIKKRNEKHYKDNKFHLIADLALVFIVFGLLTTFLVLRNLEPKIAIFVEAKTINEIITSGRVETFEIKYENNSEEIAQDATLSVNLPKDFVLTKTTPENIFNNLTNTFKVGDLDSRSSGKVSVSGLVLGETGDREVFSFSLNYSAGGHKLNTLGSLVYIIEDSVLIADWDTPKNIYKNIDFLSKINIKNLGDMDIEKDIVISFVDSGLEVKKINRPGATLNNNIITLGGLKKESSLEIEIEATTDTDQTSLSSTIATFINTGERRLQQEEIKKTFQVSIPKFNVNIGADKNVIKDGESVAFKIDYENKEEETIKQIKFDIGTSDSAFSISKLDLKEDSTGLVLNGNTISLSDNLEKNVKGSFEFVIEFKRKNIKINQGVSIIANINYQLANDLVKYRIPGPKIKLFSDLQISSKGFYYSPQGDQLGIGPLPPAVSVPTRYWVFWEFNNLGNNLENLSITAVLPDNVFWTDQKSLTAGKIRFAQIGKKIAWIVDNVSTEEEKARVGFEVELVPEIADLGKIVNLLENIEYSAYDSFAQKEIAGRLPDINTNLEFDNLASGKGKVIKIDVIR